MSGLVNWYTGADPNVPVSHAGIYGVGKLVQLLDACLVDGYGIVSVASISRTGSTATATFNTAHGFKPHSVIEVAGANETDYNGKHKIRVVDLTTVEFPVDSGAASPATGTITAKVAPLGWDKVFSGTDIAVYRSPDPASNRPYLKVIDDFASDHVNIEAYQSMSDIDTGLGRFPDATRRWPKAFSGTARYKWEIIGDETRFFFLNAWRFNNRYGRVIYGFGDLFGGENTGNYDSVVISSPTSIDTNNVDTSAVANATHAGSAAPTTLTWHLPAVAYDSVLENPVFNGVPHAQVMLREGARLRMLMPAYIPYYNLYQAGEVVVLEALDGRAWLRVPGSFVSGGMATQSGGWLWDLAAHSDGVWQAA